MTQYQQSALVVDRDPQVRLRTSRVLSEVGFWCDTAEDGKQAFEKLQARAFDLLVTDVVLPKMHGHALILEALRCLPAPRVIVHSSIVDSRIVRDLLARGVDDYLHKSVPDELLATKARSLFDLSMWQKAQRTAQNDQRVQLDEAAKLELIERQLQLLSDHFADQMADLFEQEMSTTEIPAGLFHFATQLRAAETAEEQMEVSQAACTRTSIRVKIKLIATAIQVDEHYQATDFPVNVVLSDVSTGGVRLLHTRSIPATDLVLSWDAVTIPDYVFRLPLCITRCRPIARFYDIGGQFDVPVQVEKRMKKLAEMALTVTS